jgi:pyruvate,water dikinase
MKTSDVAPAVAGQPMSGVPASPGVVTGTARIIRDPSDPEALQIGDVLVAPFTDPAWTPLFVTASAVVVEVGAPMSHAMIVCREFGIPCVTAVVGICDRIDDGAIVHVNGNTGTVTLVAP